MAMIEKKVLRVCFVAALIHVSKLEFVNYK